MEDVQQYASIIHNIANEVRSKWGAIEYGDLISAGYVGALEAIKTYDENVGTTLESFVGKKVRWAILSEARRFDYLTVHQRRICKCVGEINNKYLVKYNRLPTIDEINKETGLSKAQITNNIGLTNGWIQNPLIEELPESRQTVYDEDMLTVIKRVSPYLSPDERVVLMALCFCKDEKNILERYQKSFIDKTKHTISKIIENLKCEKVREKNETEKNVA